MTTMLRGLSVSKNALGRIRATRRLVSTGGSEGKKVPPVALSSEMEEAINKQINNEFDAAFTYFAMSYWFKRPENCYRGFSKLFFQDFEDEMK